MTLRQPGAARSASTAGTSGPILGAAEWFRPGEHERVERAVEALRRAGIHRLRTGISWTEYETPAGRPWYDWLLPRLAGDLELLPSFTPTSLGANGSAPSPDLKSYTDFIDQMIRTHGRHFEWLELWDGRLDGGWQTFKTDGAAARAKQRGKRELA